MHYRSAPVRDGGGVVVVFSDMSERTRMEEALQEASGRAARARLQAAEAERARWARELHDETLQGLAGLHVLLASASRAPSAELMAERIGLAQEQIENELEKLRGLISELRPAALDELGLEASVRDLAERIQTVYGIGVEMAVDLRTPEGAPRRVAPEVETAAYRIVQECLSNAARHAGAAHVEVELAQDNGTLEVSVVDDGGGFDPAGRRGRLRAARDARARGPAGRLADDRQRHGQRDAGHRAAAARRLTCLSRAARRPRPGRARARSPRGRRGASGPACAGCGRGGPRSCARDRNSRSAISRLVCPRAIRRSTSISRAVSSGAERRAWAVSAARRAPSRGSR